jgi:glycosyltransferase involved in cell wall biosynthesis
VKWGVPASSITVINSVYNPINIEKEVLVGEKENDTHYLRIITAGRLVPWKGFLGVLEVVARLKKTFPTIKLVIVGEGEQRDTLKRVAAELGISESVELPGRLSQTDLAHQIATSDVFILNTQYEGLSHQLIEVMNLGVPIVTTAVGGNPELITHNKNGLLVPYNNIEELVAAVTILITDKEQSEKFVREAKETVKNFSKENMMQSLVTVLKRYE